MKKIVLTMLCFCSVVVWAQKAETIETIAANSHSLQWYSEQVKAWQQQVDRHPQEEWAWRNLFRATYYHEQFSDQKHDDISSEAVIRKMETAVPDSYVLNLSKAKYYFGPQTANRTKSYVTRAIEKMPDNANADDINLLACYLWGLVPDHADVDRLLTLNYRQQHYPEHIVRYNWNMLRSMQPHALYFGNGDNVVVPMRMLQAALGERKDVTVIPLSFLYMDEFRSELCKKLGIPPFPKSYADYVEAGGEGGSPYVTDVVMHLIRETHLPSYFFTDVLQQTSLNKDHVYNEGLLLKYSEQPYDNFAVAIRNVKEVYHLEYLSEPDLSYNRWETSRMMDINNVTLLSHLIGKLRNQGDKETADRLYRILDACVKRCPVNPAMKRKVADLLKSEAI